MINRVFTNPFEPPKALVAKNELPEQFAGYTPAQIRKLYYRSCNVNGIALLIALGATAMSAMLFIDDFRSDARFLFISLLVFYGFTLVGTIRRTAWGRILGIIACVISLINVPLGTLIGVIGLFAFIKARELFGPNRITHAAVKAAFKDLKSAGVL